MNTRGQKVKVLMYLTVFVFGWRWEGDEKMEDGEEEMGSNESRRTFIVNQYKKQESLTLAFLFIYLFMLTTGSCVKNKKAPKWEYRCLTVTLECSLRSSVHILWVCTGKTKVRNKVKEERLGFGIEPSLAMQRTPKTRDAWFPCIKWHHLFLWPRTPSCKLYFWIRILHTMPCGQ